MVHTVVKLISVSLNKIMPPLLLLLVMQMVEKQSNILGIWWSRTITVDKIVLKSSNFLEFTKTFLEDFRQ